MDDVGEFRFRRLARDDFATLAAWLATPHVHRWWAHEFDPAAIERDFGDAVDGTEPTNAWIAELDGVPIGYVQDYVIADYPEYVAELAPVVELPAGVVSIDYFIGVADLVGRGVGTRMLTHFVGELWTRHPAATAVLVPVNSRNVASWRALAAGGFRLEAVADLEPDSPGDPPAHHLMRSDRPEPRSATG